MKKIIAAIVLSLFVFVGISSPVTAEAKSRTSYYKSAKTGRFTTKSYSSSHKSTTYKSYRKSR